MGVEWDRERHQTIDHLLRQKKATKPGSKRDKAVRPVEPWGRGAGEKKPFVEDHNIKVGQLANDEGLDKIGTKLSAESETSINSGNRVG